ncbi:MAG: histidinol dehydrogenase, partial [Haliea sp.]
MTLQARPLRLSTADAGFEAAFQARLHWSAETDTQVEQAVTDILAAVRSRGDEAVLEFTRRFDGLSADGMGQLELKPVELKAAFDGLPADQ